MPIGIIVLKTKSLKNWRGYLKKRDKAMTKLINSILNSDAVLSESCDNSCPATNICLKYGNISCSETINIWANM